MSSRAETTTAIVSMLLILTSGLLSGCFRAHRCGEETCDYGDTDCDGRVDEAFLDDQGRYVTDEHCGGCGVNCAEAFPTAAETACELDVVGTPRCVIVACPPGFHRSGAGGCAPDLPVLCLPCAEDADCTLGLPGSRCVELGTTGATEPRCMPPCETECPAGFSCGAAGVCLPDSGTCTCAGDAVGSTFACLVTGPSGDRCAGAQTCELDGLGECLPVLEEACDGVDDDCDGATDETFVDGAGRFAVDPLHCGGCDTPCAPPGPNMQAECVADDAAPGGGRCEVACIEGFVDVDGLPGNGCECERFDGTGPPPAVGGDADCDGVVDDDNQFIYVTPTGNDTDPGTLLRPMRTLAAALVRAGSLTPRRDVLVATGEYEGVVPLVEGVSAFGGYRADFRDRDLGLHPVTLTRGADPGAPVVTCAGLGSARLDGFTVRGSDAVSDGAGSTTMRMDGCGAGVTLSNLIIHAGRGADGRAGDSSSDNLAELDATLTSLAQLEGQSGGVGGRGTATGLCSRVPGGAGGVHRCGSLNVSGGRGGGDDCAPLVCTNGLPCANAGCTDFTVGGVCDFASVMALAVPNPAAQAGSGPGAGAAGEDSYDSPTNRGVCNFCDDNPTLQRLGDDGDDGARGDDGAAGLGCDGGVDVDALGRVSGGGGTDGQAGTHGGGGGGGGTGSGYAVIGNTSGFCDDRAGGGGGGGGSGGCGAPRAEGGQGGGASVAIFIVSLGAGGGPTFTDSRVQTASGGAGGDGGIGAAGGQGGSGASGGVAPFWCARNGGRGGDGGDGGAGGPGGGGCGGGSHAVLIAETGAASDAYLGGLPMTLEVDAVGVPGVGGRGGFSPGGTTTAGLGGDGAPFASVP